MVDNISLPKWATPDRKEHLVVLFKRSGGFCVFGHKNCQVPEHHYYCFIEDLIADWKALDTDQRLADWEAEAKALHCLGERRFPLNGRFNAISQTIYADNQPLYFVENLGVSGLTFQPFAKVRISSSYVRLYIDLGDTLKRVSKNKRRKALRYGKPLPFNIQTRVRQIIFEAVRHYQAH